MKLKFIFEKFVKDSDPISDMRIGIKKAIKKFSETETEYDYDEGDLLWICAESGKHEFVEYLLNTGIYDHENAELSLCLASYGGHDKVVKFLLDAGVNVHVDNDFSLRYAIKNKHSKVVKIINDHIAKEKKLKECLDEKFVEDSDPISDLGIGLKSIYNNIEVGDIFRFKKDLPNFNSGYHKKGYFIRITNLYKYPNQEYDIRVCYDAINKKGEILSKLDSWQGWEWSYDFFKEYIEPVYLKNLKQ